MPCIPDRVLDKTGVSTYVLNLPLIEIRDHANDDPRKSAAEVNNLVHDEAQDTRSKGVVLHPHIPRRPKALSHVQLNIILGDFVKHAKKRRLRLVEMHRR